MKHLQDLQVLVLGLGTSGLAMTRWCVRHGACVRVWDSRGEAAPGFAQVKSMAGVTVWPSSADTGLSLDALEGMQLILKSPGLGPEDGKIQALWAEAEQRGLARQGELELWAHALRDLQATDTPYAPKVAAITGTNGKTTTTSLTALLLERAGLRVATAGNIGPSMLDVLSERCLDQADRSQWPEVWVLELSSFQLDGVRDFEPTAATVLNLTQDHLDWHGSMAAYGAAKARVFGERAVMVVNRNDALVAQMAQDLLTPKPKTGKASAKAQAAQVIQAAQTPPATRSRRAQVAMRPVVRFGTDAPQAPGDFGIVSEGGIAWLVCALDDSAGGHRHDSDVMLQRLMPVDALRIRGRHNAANALAALALATALGCSMRPLLHGLREYRGEPHRVESIAVLRDVEAIDDSKGTNVGATVAAIEGLGADRGPSKLVVILGGDGKGQDFAPLAAPLAKYARAVALIGRDAVVIDQALQDLPVIRHHAQTLEAATRWCFEQARTGDAVLLSPACASLDMFRNYAHRAEVFVATVQALAAEHGEVSA